MKQREQKRTVSFTSAMASDKRSAVALSALRIQYAIRCADFGPTPGKRSSSSSSF